MRLALRMRYLATSAKGKGCAIALAALVVALIIVGLGLQALIRWATETPRDLTGGELAGAIGAGLGLVVVALVIPVKILSAAFGRASEAARQHALAVPLTCAGACGSCGAPARVPMWGGAADMPCPMCGTPLMAEGELRDRLQGAREREGLEVGAESLREFEEALASLTGSADRRVRDRPIPGIGKFSAAPDSTSEYREGPVTMWSTTEMFPSALLTLLEVDAPLAVDGTMWLLPPRGAERHEELARLKGFPVPATDLGALPSGHRALVDSPFADLERARQIAEGLDLGRDESLRLDPGGLSFWKVGRAGARAENLGYTRWLIARGESATALCQRLLERPARERSELAGSELADPRR